MSNGIPRSTLFSMYLTQATAMEAKGIQPTGRKLKAAVRGGKPSDYPQGVGGNDRLAFDNAMVTLGYAIDKKSGRWKKYIPGLDEVMCNEPGDCAHFPEHTLAAHVYQEP
jgi:hypothetical protein